MMFNSYSVNVIPSFKANFLMSSLVILLTYSLIKNKLFGKEKEREKYMDVSEDLYKNGIIKTDTFEDLKSTYIFSKEHDSKEKDRDDFDLEI